MRSSLPLTALFLLSMACESEVPRPPKAGETCWTMSDYAKGYGDEFCDVQFCTAKERSFSANVGSGTGLVCQDGPACTKPTEPGPYTEATIMEYAGDGFSVMLAVSPQLFIDGYSTENFQKHVIQAWVQFVAAPGFGETNAATTYPAAAGEVSVLSYDEGLLHVRVTGRGREASTVVDTPPYICSGHFTYSTCHTKWCSYSSEDGTGSGESMTAVADVTVPVAPVAP